MFSVYRHLFFTKNFSPTLRFTEHAPPKEEYDHAICNCTKHVAERPKGEPRQISFGIQLAGEDVEFGLINGWLTFNWEMAPKDKIKLVYPFDRDNTKQHAYFMFNPKERSVSIEITMPGVGNVDCFFAHLYMGNKIDISRFFNGHSQSKIVDLSKIPDEAIWLHCCNYIGERIEFIESAESQAWRDMLIRMEQLFQLMSKYEVSLVPVEDILQEVKGTPDIYKIASDVIDGCRLALNNIRDSDLFKVQQSINQSLKD